jgi:hypothetical protein
LSVSRCRSKISIFGQRKMLVVFLISLLALVSASPLHYLEAACTAAGGLNLTKYNQNTKSWVFMDMHSVSTLWSLCKLRQCQRPTPFTFLSLHRTLSSSSPHSPLSANVDRLSLWRNRNGLWVLQPTLLLRRLSVLANRRRVEQCLSWEDL